MARTDLQRLWATAQGLRPARRPRKPLPRLLLFTDPARTPDVEALAARLPRGAGVVFRHFGAPDAAARAGRLRAIARRRGLTLLIGADASIPADGVHAPERLAFAIPRLKRRRAIVTAAAHSPMAAMRAARLGADAVVVSTVFESGSPSAGRPIGPVRLAALAQRLPVPVYALGGLNVKNARRLSATGVVGLAMVEGLAEALRT